MKELYKKYRELIHYLIAGVMTTVVSLVVYYGTTAAFFDVNRASQLQAANILSWIAGVTFAYFVNRRFVFESQNTDVLNEAFKFYLARLGTLLMDMAVMGIGVSVVGGDDRYVKLLSQVIVIVANYVISKLFVFRKQK
ncbi:MAG: GtrA family protein [Lachnospiraceae bacterium]|nr:GtrA family protein [Lachnospiraceae bacterium]